MDETCKWQDRMNPGDLSASSTRLLGLLLTNSLAERDLLFLRAASAERVTSTQREADRPP
jgi:hypothetical protein